MKPLLGRGYRGQKETYLQRIAGQGVKQQLRPSEHFPSVKTLTLECGPCALGGPATETIPS
jgi:hypothetical protein